MKFNQIFKKFLAVAAATSMVLAGSYSVYAPANDTPDETCSLANYAEGTYWSDWQIKGMGLDKFQNAFANKTNLPEIVVAVLDTGCNYNDAGFAGRILVDKAICVTNATTVLESSGHGTNTTRGVIDATPSNIKILPIRISDSSGSIYDSTIAKGINAAINAGAHVIQIASGHLESTAGTIHPDIQTAMKAADAKGIIVCCSAGNLKTDTKYCPPANSPYCISVAAADNGMTLTARSDYDATITSYSHNDGTSYAVPNATAVAAMLKTIDSSINRTKMVEIISTMAIDIGAKGKDNIYGNGFLYMGDFIQNNDIHCLHSYVRQELSDATCSTPGQIRFSCSKCGTSFTRTEEPRHQYIVKSSEGSCTEDGGFSIKCALCGDVKVNNITSTATGHDYQTTTTTTGKGKNKKTVTVTKCTKCGAEPCTAHSYTKTTVTEANCMQAGLVNYSCNNCGESYSETISKREHTYTSKVVKEPTNTTTGIVAYTCTGCGDTYYETTAIQFACATHSYTKTTVKAATCTTNGVERYTCQKCGDSYDKTIAATGHTKGKGKNKNTCTKCGAKL